MYYNFKWKKFLRYLLKSYIQRLILVYTVIVLVIMFIAFTFAKHLNWFLIFQIPDKIKYVYLFIKVYYVFMYLIFISYIFTGVWFKPFICLYLNTLYNFFSIKINNWYYIINIILL